jgi:hypothetical protein
MTYHEPPIRDARDTRPSSYQKSTLATVILLGFIAAVMGFMLWKIGIFVDHIVHPDLPIGISLEN